MRRKTGFLTLGRASALGRFAQELQQKMKGHQRLMPRSLADEEHVGKARKKLLIGRLL